MKRWLLGLTMMLLGLQTIAQTTLTEGDVAVVQYNADDPDRITIVLLRDLTAGTVFHLTDNGFASTTAGRTGEGFLTFTVPTGGYTKGQTFTWISGQGSPWSGSTAPVLSGSGDQIFIFQGSTTNWASQTSIKLISGINFSSPFITSGTATSNNSYAPLNLSSSYITQLTSENGYLSGTTSTTTAYAFQGSTKQFRGDVFSASKWFTNATGPLTSPTYSISVYSDYFAKSTGNLSVLSNWGEEADGTGITPVSFTDTRQRFNITTAASLISSSLTISGTSTQLNVGNGTNSSNLTVNNGAMLTIGTGTVVTIAPNAAIYAQETLDFGELNFGNNPVILKSNANGTGKINSASTIINATNITVERYISGKAARKSILLASPVTQSLSSAWQQQIHITGPGTGGIACVSGATTGQPTANSNGFDATQLNNPSAFVYVNGANPAWQSISGTGINLTPGTGYRVLVRGPRTQGCELLSGATSGTAQAAVTLSATGTLQTNPFSPSLGTGFNLVGNPYAADLDFSNSAFRTTLANNGIDRKFWAYNPAINNNSGNSTVVWSIRDYSTGTAESVNMAGVTNPDLIGQGQAIFFNRTTGTGTVNNLITRDFLFLGTASQTSYFRTAQQGQTAGKVRIALQSSGAQHLDEMLIRYLTHTDATNTGMSSYDALSLTTGTEGISSRKSGLISNLAIQSRRYDAQLNDTLTLNVKGVAGTSYQLYFSDLANTTEEVFLRDKLLNTLTNVKAVASYPFTASATLPSTERFEIIYRSSSTLASKFITVAVLHNTATGKNEVSFTAQEDGNTSLYQLESSNDGQSFETVTGVEVSGSLRAGQFSYRLEDNRTFLAAQTMYYRLRALGNSVNYSSVVKVQQGEKNAVVLVTAYPNPVADVFYVQVGSQHSGQVDLLLTDVQGRIVLSKRRQMSSGIMQSLAMEVKNLAAGSYILQVRGKNGLLLHSQPVVKQ